MSKLSDMIISAILKRGVLGEFKNFETKADIPQESGNKIVITIKAENLQVRMDEQKKEV